MTTLYSNNHTVDVYQHGTYSANKSVLVEIYQLSDGLQIKAKDKDEPAFNYTKTLNASAFETMRRAQNLDIGFCDLVPTVVEMLQQHSKQQMLLKVDLVGEKCQLIFHEKVKIKMVVFLCVELEQTCSQEIIRELSANLRSANDRNDSLARSLKTEAERSHRLGVRLAAGGDERQHLVRAFRQGLHHVGEQAAAKMAAATDLYQSRIAPMAVRLAALASGLDALRQRYAQSAASADRMARRMADDRLHLADRDAKVQRLEAEADILRRRLSDQTALIDGLKQEAMARQFDNMAAKSKQAISDEEKGKAEAMLEEARRANAELANDLVQANRMLVMFDGKLEEKQQRLGEAEAQLAARTGELEAQAARCRAVGEAFEAYKATHSDALIVRLRRENAQLKADNETAGEDLRKIGKMNALLLAKLNPGSL